MNNLKVLILGLCLVGTINAQNNTPKEVTNAFSKKFPTATAVKWGKESATEWEAEFKMDGIKYSANFSTNGTWKETEHKIKFTQLPENIKTSVKSHFPHGKIEAIEVSETASGQYYECMIEDDETDMEVVFDHKGTLLKKSVEADEDSDND